MKELSIFIDESGDFWEYNSHSPYYIIAMVMHGQAYDMTVELNKLEQELQYIGYSNHCVHAGPIIRQVNIKYKTVFITLFDNVEFRKVIPSDYRLFQVADLVCTLQLLEIKCDKHTLSNSEKRFFENDRILKKNYIIPLKQKLIN